ncbi:MAG: hypothetical protein F6J99_25845 [Moorea sp. SIO4G3]|nr:hypothetical protein [Moorena sp. SIO4G3]
MRFVSQLEGGNNLVFSKMGMIDGNLEEDNPELSIVIDWYKRTGCEILRDQPISQTHHLRRFYNSNQILRSVL